MIIESGDLRIRLGGGDRWTITLPNLRPGTPSTTRPDTVVQVFRRQVDSPPVASFTIDANENDGTVTITDTSTDAVALASIDVDWGDGTVDEDLTPGGTYMHTYATTDTYTIQLTATDTAGQSDTASQNVSVTVLWTPDQLAGVLWLRADDVTTDPVSDWPNRYGSDASQGTAAEQPDLVPNALNGEPVVDGDGVDDGLTAPAAVTSADTIHAFAVVDYTAETLTRVVLALASPGPSQEYLATIDVGDAVHYFVGDNSTGNPIAVSDAPHTIEYLWDIPGGTYATGVDATRVTGTTGATLDVDADTAYILQPIGGFGSALDSPLAELLLYTSELSTADRERVEGYTAHRYGYEAQLPNGHPYETNPPTI